MKVFLICILYLAAGSTWGLGTVIAVTHKYDLIPTVLIGIAFMLMGIFGSVCIYMFSNPQLH